VRLTWPTNFDILILDTRARIHAPWVRADWCGVRLWELKETLNGKALAPWRVRRAIDPRKS
jgi:hypothetical protein